MDFTQSDVGILKQGNLAKRGEKVKNWNTRWFVLKQNVMNYYEVLGDGELKVQFTLFHLIPFS
tara:strand:- start:867 stop:1055 length:189 start_codon:yes stop_codon:yes gene_type:complete